MRPYVSVSRSMKAELAPSARTSATSSAWPREWWSHWRGWRARSLPARGSFAQAWRAPAPARRRAHGRRDRSSVQANRPVASIAFSGAVMSVPASVEAMLLARKSTFCEKAGEAWLRAWGRPLAAKPMASVRRKSRARADYEVVAVGSFPRARDAEDHHHIGGGRPLIFSASSAS